PGGRDPPPDRGANQALYRQELRRLARQDRGLGTGSDQRLYPAQGSRALRPGNIGGQAEQGEGVTNPAAVQRNRCAAGEPPGYSRPYPATGGQGGAQPDAGEQAP